MRVPKENQFSRKPLIQQHVFAGNTGRCLICNEKSWDIMLLKIKCVKRRGGTGDNGTMTDIIRQVTVNEGLPIKPCPFCGGNIIAGDCGYSAFNPGFARCEGKCKREFKLGYVDSRWQAGLLWNEYEKKAVEIEAAEKKLKQLRGE